jgi:two-component system, chemotaxis family, CheB/CheR fusion protein
MMATLSPSGASPSALSGICVLVIENDPDNLEMFAEFLRHCGAKVTGALSGTTALRCLVDQHVDVITTDLSILKGSGISEFLRHIRSMPEHALTPIIAVSGWQERDITSPGEAAFSAFMLKPINLDDLSETILRLVQNN